MGSDGSNVSGVSQAAGVGQTGFDVRPGGVYELTLLLQRVTGSASDGLTVTSMPFQFFDDDGAEVDPYLVLERPRIPGFDPLKIETMPNMPIDERFSSEAAANRFLIAPPDAARLELGPPPQGVAIRHATLSKVDLAWSAEESMRLRRSLDEKAKKRRDLIGAKTSVPAPAADLILNWPKAQIEALEAWFTPANSWKDTLETLGQPDNHQDYFVRMDRLKSQAANAKRIGFIGSERGHERLCGMADVFWLREAEYADQIAQLDFDLIIIETANFSGARAEDQDWALAFSSLDGSLPDNGAALLQAAKDANVSVHLWVTIIPQATKLWSECANSVDRVVVETSGDEDWSELKVAHQMIRRAMEPTACSIASLNPGSTDLVLVPGGSDVLQFPEFSALLSECNLDPLVSEFRFRFSRVNLEQRLGPNNLFAIGDHTRAHARAMLQAARFMLISAQTMRSRAELEALILHAIGAGTIPIVFGDTEGGPSIMKDLPRCDNAAELMEVVGLYRVQWVWERHWRALFRKVMQSYVWKSEDREALFGSDPFPEGFDTPKVTSVLVTRRPELIDQCFESFRKQSWPNKELVMVFNTLDLPSDMPATEAGEQIFALSETANIGECLNRGITRATGRYWVKMDDDDLYSATYLEESAWYYRATQADVVGRSTPFFYFAGQNSTSYRPNPLKINFHLIGTAGHISGATLSADKAAGVPLFSVLDRNSADSNWVNRLKREKWRIQVADTTSMVVYRDADETKHTWSIGTNPALVKGLKKVSEGHIGQRFERSPL